jgi:RNA polymerase sigma-70 factor (ECF subfamily)
MIGGATAVGTTELERAYLDSHAALIRLLARQLRSRDAAEDMAQDLFVAISEAQPSAAVRNPRAFVFRIANHLASNRLKQDSRRASLRAANADILWTAVDELTPERQLLDSEALATIGAAIERLPARTRQILAWRRIDGLTNREIASRLGISDTAVEKHMRNAMAALVRALEQDNLPYAG